MGDVLAFEAFPKIDRYTNETFTITEKIDGTNACINFEPAVEEDGWNKIDFSCQSRNRLIEPGNDNAGFAAWVYDNVRDLFELLGPGRHYGEWWGKGIQRNYGQDAKRFSLFNSHRWSHLRFDEHKTVIGGIQVDSVPVLAQDQLDALPECVSDAHEELRVIGSHAAPGFMNPEGCMIYLHRLGRYLKAPLDATPKWQQEAA